MIRRRGLFLALCGLVAWVSPGRSDQFEQFDGPMLIKAMKGPEATARPSLTVADLGGMPALLRDSRSALVLASTDRGNPVRLLIVPELRKPAGGQGEPIPVVVLERVDAFDAADPSTRLASRRDVVVFDGFRVDLDTGQVVPEGQGGDVVFRAGGEGGPRLEAVGPARLFTIARAPTFDTTGVPQPTPGRSVVAGDFAGRYRLFANGQWSGTLDLKVEPRGVITGRFRSDLHGTAYAVTGQVATDAAQKVRFAISFPRARQEFEGYLWGEGKGAMAGTVSLLERTFGFFALREGGRYAPEGVDLGPPVDEPGRHVVEIQGDRLLLDGKPSGLDELAGALRPMADADPAPWVLLRAPADRTLGDVLRIAEAVQAAGIRVLRIEEARPRGGPGS